MSLPVGIISQSAPLPKTLDEASVGLLMRITSTKTDPVLVYPLPNGLGIYQTPPRTGMAVTMTGPMVAHIKYSPGVL